MHYHNESEIKINAARFRNHTVLGPATQFLSDFRDLVNSVSDGWCYWQAPVKSADRLMTLIENPNTATPDAFKRALTPIRSFCTRHKLAMPEIRNA